LESLTSQVKSSQLTQPHSGTLRLRDARGCVVCTPCETEHRAQARALARGGAAGCLRLQA
jgi:hypothetical protein